MTGVCSTAVKTLLSLRTGAGASILEFGIGISDGDGGRHSSDWRLGGGGGMFGGDSGLSCCEMCAFGGIVNVGRRGRAFGVSSYVIVISGGVFRDSVVDGRASVTATTTPTVVLDGLIISNSGSLVGGMVVYFVLKLRFGKRFLLEAVRPI